MTGTVLSIERCSLHDGPGLRTTVFLKGCPLSCLWCHNPESRSPKQELFYIAEKCTACGLCMAVCNLHSLDNTSPHVINRGACVACGKCAESCPQSALEIKGVIMSAQAVIEIALKDLRYYKTSGGGLTISGGEPLAQHGFSLELLRLAKEKGLHNCLETSGYASTEKMLSLVPYVDLFLYDFKISNEDEHKKFTAVPRKPIVDNLQALNDAGAKIVLRCPIIPTYNDTLEHFKAISATAEALPNVLEVNIMPYHPMGSSKAVRIGKEYPISAVDFPKAGQIEDWLKAVGDGTGVVVKRG